MTSAAPALEQLQLLLTERCNLRCTHCAVPEEGSPATHELTTDQWCAFIGEALRSGIRRIVLSGGEALLRRDCLTIAEHALHAGADAVVIVTNGTVLPVTTVVRLAGLQQAWPSLLLHVSLDGCRDVTHDLIRGTGAFARTMAGLARLRNVGGRVDGVHTVVNRANVNELARVASLARGLGASSWTVFPIAALGRGVERDEIRLGHDAWVDLLADLAAHPPPGLELGLMGPTVGDEWADPYAVPTPRASHSPQACVGPDGAVFTCPPLRHVEAGKALDVAAASAWAATDARLRATLDGACPRCKYRSLCTGVDPAAGLLTVVEPFGEPQAVHVASSVAVSLGRAEP